MPRDIFWDSNLPPLASTNSSQAAQIPSTMSCLRFQPYSHWDLDNSAARLPKSYGSWCCHQHGSSSTQLHVGCITLNTTQGGVGSEELCITGYKEGGREIAL